MSATVAARRVRPPKWAVWRDRQGNFSSLKTTVLIGACLPGLFIAYWWITGELGPRTVNAAIHLTGLWTLRFVLLSLAVTPARAIFDWPRIVLVRRMLGVTAMAYGLAHFSLYVIDMNFALGEVASEIVKRFYLTIGFIALLGLVALGATSTDAAVRRLGRGWKWLHRSIYALAVLMLWHHFLQSKAGVGAAVFAAGLFVWLMAWRVSPPAQRSKLAWLALLVPLTGLLAAGIEYGWFDLATRIDPRRVLVANLNFTFGPRPAIWAAIVAAAVTLAAAAMRITRRPRRP